MTNTQKLSEKETKFLINLIKSGRKTKRECIDALKETFGRTIHTRNLSEFARRYNLFFKEVQPDAWTEREESIIKGLWLVEAGQQRRLQELPSRGLKSMQRKLQDLKLKGLLNKQLRNKIDKDITNGISNKEISKKYEIDEKFVKEYVDKTNKTTIESTVEIENLRRWEEADVNDVLDGIEEQQIRMKKLDSEQNVANISITTSGKYIALMFLSDIHLENVNTDVKQLRRDVDIIRDTKDFYVGFGGDLIDNFFVGPHKEGIVEAVIPPKAARIVAGKLLDKLRGRLLWTILGCHDAWDLAYAAYCLPEHISRKQGIPYLGHGGDVNLTIKNNKNKEITYSMHVRHKYKGTGGDNGTACCKNVLRNIDSKFDMVAISHNHFAEIKIEHFLRKERVFIRTGSYKKEDSYSKMLGFETNDFNSKIPVVILNTQTKEMTICSGVKKASDTLKALNKLK